MVVNVVLIYNVVAVHCHDSWVIPNEDKQINRFVDDLFHVGVQYFSSLSDILTVDLYVGLLCCGLTTWGCHTPAVNTDCGNQPY